MDRLGFTNSYGWDALRRMTSHTNQLGFYTLWNYCSCGALDSIRDAENHYTYFYYDDAGRKTATVSPDSYAITNNFNLIGEITNTIDNAGTSITNGFNNQGLLCTVSNFFGRVSTAALDLEDRATNSVDANGVSVNTAFDDLGRVRTRAYPDGGVESFGYANGALIAYTNQIGNVTRYVYDEALRKRYETNANLEVIEFRYNPSGSLTNLIDGKSQKTAWSYDSFGRVTNKSDNLGTAVFTYKYDGLDRLTNRWTPAKGNTYYAYSAVGNLTNINYPSDTDVSFAWDAMNRCTNMVDDIGTTVYSYDAAGQLLTEHGPFTSDTVTNTYSNRLRVGLAVAQPVGYWTNGFGYDPAKRLTNVTMSAGSFVYEYAAPKNRLAWRLTVPNTSYVTNNYDSQSRLLTTSLQNSSGSVLDAYTYTYDQANERSAVTRTDSSSVGYTYDKIGQLTVADSSVNTEDRGYLYDAAWNLNRRTNNGVSSAFSVNSLNELTNANGSAIAYDLNGNITNENSADNFTYDDENRLIMVSDDTYHSFRTAFYYDGRSRLRQRQEYTWTGAGPLQVAHWALASAVIYIYDGNRVIQERDGASNTPLVAYTRGPDLGGTMEGAGGIGGLLARSDGYQTGSGAWTNHVYYHADGNGNITYLVDASQNLAASYRYDPFGNLISSSGFLANANVYRFSSKELMLNSGLYYYLYRFYDPNLQRWLSRDPLGDIAPHGLKRLVRPAESLKGNRTLYCFVGNQPVGEFDVDGRLLAGLLDELLQEALEAVQKNCDSLFPGNCELCCGLTAMGRAAGATAAFVADMVESGVVLTLNPVAGVADFIVSHGIAVLKFYNQGRDYKDCLNSCKCKHQVQ